MSTHIPANWAMQGNAIPTVCARHGRPEVRRARTAISQATPGWMYALLLFGLVGFILARAVGVSSISAAQWPFCDRCVKQRRMVLLGATATVVMGVAAFLLAFSVERPWLILLGLLLIVAGAVAFNWGTWSRLSAARLTDHTAWVEVRQPHPEFAARIAALGTQAAAATTAPVVTTLQPPAPIVKKLNPVWYIALVVGITLAATGAFDFAAGVNCGAEKMRPGDVCETTNSSGLVTVSTYEEEAAFTNGMTAAGVVGLLVAIGAGIRVRRWNRALKQALAERTA